MPNISPPPTVASAEGGLQFRDAKAILATVVDNGVDPEDPRVLLRTNEATKIILDAMIPVGGMATYNVTAVETFLTLPPQLENCIEAYPADPNTTVRGSTDITQGWYEIVNDSVYLDPLQHHDNPLIDLGLRPEAGNASILHRTYQYPGLAPANAVVVVTGKKRYLPLKTDDDYLIVQNLEALKCVIQSIERYENAAPDEGQKYRQQALEMLQSEVKQHIMDPRNYMRRKNQYQDEATFMAENTLGWVRANLALDVEEALKTGRIDLTWTINQIERRIMHNGTYKDMVITIQAQVTGGIVYFPINVQSVLAVSLCGAPIPIRSQFFQSLDNGPGAFPCNNMLIDQGDEMIPGTSNQRRKYKLIADCSNQQLITAVCLLRWIAKEPGDLMTIKNYEAIRLMYLAKNFEEREKWQEAAANQKQAFEILDKELERYLSGIRHTVHVQTDGFGLGDVGDYWTM